MTKRHIALLALVLACFAGAIFAIIWSTEQARQRSMNNLNIICNELERLTGMPCALEMPPSGIADGERQSRNTTILPTASPQVKPAPSSQSDCNILISTNERYHDLNSPYRGMIREGAPCFNSLEEARSFYPNIRSPG